MAEDTGMSPEMDAMEDAAGSAMKKLIMQQWMLELHQAMQRQRQ